MTDVRRGTVLAFNASAWTATVMLDGADAESQIPVAQWVEAQMMVANAEVAVLVYGDTNTDDGVVLGPYGGLGQQNLNTTATPQFSALNVGGALAAPAGEVRTTGVVRANSVTDVGMAMQKINSLANLGKATLNGLPGMAGFLFIFNSSVQFAIYTVAGGGHATQEISDPANAYSITAGTAFTNIYWNGSAYELENRTGGALSYYISYLGN